MYPIADENLKHDVILGLDFLKLNKTIVDLENKTLSIATKQGARVLMTVKETNEINLLGYSNVPIYAAQDMNIKGLGTQLLNVYVHDINLCGREWYFEGKNDEHTVFHDGIINNDKKKIICGCKSMQKRKIKRDEKVGIISMLVEEKATEDSEKWTREELRKTGKFGANECNRKEKNIRNVDSC